MSSIYDWTLVANNNGTIDDEMIWKEEQPPYTVNNSARVMMSRLKGYIQDTSLTNSFMEYTKIGKENYYTKIHIQSNARPDKLIDGIVFQFRADRNNRGITLISVDGLADDLVYKATLDGIMAVTDDDIIANGVYTVSYVADGTHKGWHLLNPTEHKQQVIYEGTSLPSGVIAAFATEKLPDGWLLCDGKAYDQHAYADLYSVIGNFWGADEQSGTFRVPDFRSLFLRGYSDEHEFGMQEADDFALHQHSLKMLPIYQGKTDREMAEIMLGHPPITQYNLGALANQLHGELFIVEDQYLGMLFFDADGYRCHPFTGVRLRCSPTPAMLLFAQASTILLNRPPMHPPMPHMNEDGYMSDESDPDFDLCDALGGEDCGETAEGEAVDKEQTETDETTAAETTEDEEIKEDEDEEETHPMPPHRPMPPPMPPYRPTPHPSYDRVVRLGLRAMRSAFHDRTIGTFHPKYGVGYILDDHLWREQYGDYPVESVPLGTTRYYNQDGAFEPEPFDDFTPLCRDAIHTHLIEVLSEGAHETRPVNVVVTYGIKT